MSGKQKQIFNTSHILTSLAIGAIFGAYALVRISDSQTVILAGHTQELASLENSIVPRTEFEQTILRIDQRLESIEKRIDSVDGKLDRLLAK